jgi:G patch domain-containing protein 1
VSVAGLRITLIHERETLRDEDDPELLDRGQSPPPPQYPASEASTSRPPPFSSLYASPEADSEDEEEQSYRFGVLEAGASASSAAPAYAAVAFPPFDSTPNSSGFLDTVAETKRVLPQDTKGESSRKEDEGEPPPAYSEGPSPLHSFTYLMAAAGGAASIITQVQQGGPSVNSIGGETRT